MQWYDNQGHTSEPYSRLLGHNGAHTIKLHNINAGTGMEQTTSQSTFVCDEVQVGQISHNYGMFHTIDIDRATDHANVQNLKLTSVTSTPGNSDYFKFYAGDERAEWRHPQVQFNIVDDNESAHSTGAHYLWKVRVRSTDVDNEEWAGSVLISGIASGTGEVTAFVNSPGVITQTQVKDALSDPNADHNAYAPLEEAGTYTFEISVKKLNSVDNELDSVLYRSAKVFFPHYMPDMYPFRSGHGGEIRTDENGIERYYVHYHMQDTTPNLPAGRQAKDLKIEMLPPGWEEPIAQSDAGWGHNLKTS